MYEINGFSESNRLIFSSKFSLTEILIECFSISPTKAANQFTFAEIIIMQPASELGLKSLKSTYDIQSMRYQFILRLHMHFFDLVMFYNKIKFWFLWPLHLKSSCIILSIVFFTLFVNVMSSSYSWIFIIKLKFVSKLIRDAISLAAGGSAVCPAAVDQHGWFVPKGMSHHHTVSVTYFIIISLKSLLRHTSADNLNDAELL